MPQSMERGSLELGDSHHCSNGRQKAKLHEGSVPTLPRGWFPVAESLYCHSGNYTCCSWGKVRSPMGTWPESPPESIALHIEVPCQGNKI
ncbi:hypothetical protein BRADI_2g53289v3 [Brachypodium distachyon]|uniref:Uncharacterized protein n=1 Tax=Brachypodium distachyon TaxID=15368 RepID=A0A2K2DFQ1_BRADI|nr:hypothetical protein BRADI_2g53289v3 [Brachypodium distachyon]